VYDAIGDALQGTYRVLALTPRGFGESDAPAAGPYTIAALVEDLGALLDSAGVGRAVLVGHSLSGTVASRFALEHPERVAQLVLLDAFPYYLEEGGETVDAKNPVSTPAFEGDTTYRAVAAYLARYRFVPWNAAFEADLRAKPLEPEASRRRDLTGAYITDQWRAPPDLRGLRVPSVQVCARPTVLSEYPWLSSKRTAHASASQFVRDHLTPFARRLCDRYERTVPLGRTRVLAGSHYVFFTHPQRTIEVLRQVVGPRRQ
jgi:pimeloyl-ACP methyl ester carboxylesterase